MRGQPAGGAAHPVPQPISPPPNEMVSSRPGVISRDDRTMLAGAEEGATMIAAQPAATQASLMIVRSLDDTSGPGRQISP